MGDVLQRPFTLDHFWSDLDVGTMQYFIKKYCVHCNSYFTSNHPQHVFRKYSISILTGLDLTKMEADF